MKRPSAIWIGPLLMLARSVSGIAAIVVILTEWQNFARTISIDLNGQSEQGGVAADIALWIFVGVYAAGQLFYIALAGFVFLGQSWARNVAMAVATLSILFAFGNYLLNGAAITFKTTLLGLTLDILILLTLSSAPAREFARGRKLIRVTGI
ncbi:hypothetical protein [Glaciibacter psychrotolerans]|uniref:Uncharacterized protein n=1 Tax=Glaciibacter psychrotolerans TaxID=670054 RepID=A0A7Z0EGN4_9MICO|nr:hypothetical protein [Leifsonia psychrotolerans]NYJ20905.1 hypothetical protein [Leifsonia psychrotolerans]